MQRREHSSSFRGTHADTVRGEVAARRGLSTQFDPPQAAERDSLAHDRHVADLLCCLLLAMISNQALHWMNSVPQLSPFYDPTNIQCTECLV